MNKSNNREVSAELSGKNHAWNLSENIVNLKQLG